MTPPPAERPKCLMKLTQRTPLSEEAARRSHLDLQMLDAVQDKPGIENDADSGLADLEQETRPEDVPKAIEDLQQVVRRKKRSQS